MKKFILCLSILLINSILSFGFRPGVRQHLTSTFLNSPHSLGLNSTLTFLTDSSYYWSWDSLSISWILTSKKIYQNDGLGHHLSKTYLIWNNPNWDNDSREIYGYDLNFNLTLLLTQQWDGATWANTSEWTTTYDANNNYIYDLIQNWNGIGWDNDKQIYYSWNANNKLDSMIEQTWNGSSWINSDYTTFQYDLNNLETSEVSHIWDGAQWVLNDRALLTYNAHGDMIESLYQFWDSSGWENNSRTQYNFDVSFRQTGYTSDGWNGSNWLPITISTFYLDNNDQVNNIVSISIFGADSSHYFYSIVDQIENLQKVKFVSVFPNPASDFITMKLPRKTSKEFQLNISDLTGRKIINEILPLSAVTNDVTINIIKLTPGVYLMNLQTGDEIYVSKIIRQ
jgi:hypothetical protein